MIEFLIILTDVETVKADESTVRVFRRYNIRPLRDHATHKELFTSHLHSASPTRSMSGTVTWLESSVIVSAVIAVTIRDTQHVDSKCLKHAQARTRTFHPRRGSTQPNDRDWVLPSRPSPIQPKTSMSVDCDNRPRFDI